MTQVQTQPVAHEYGAKYRVSTRVPAPARVRVYHLRVNPLKDAHRDPSWLPRPIQSARSHSTGALKWRPRQSDTRGMKTLRILLLADSPYMGGMTSHVLSILDGFVEREGFEFTVASFPAQHPDETLLEMARERGVDVHVFPMAWKFDLRVLGGFRRFVGEQGIDLIHAHSYRSTLIPYLARVDVPVITTSHGIAVEPTLSTRFWQWAMLRAMRRHRMNIGCSDFVRQWLIAQGCHEDKVTTVHNCYSPPEAGVSPSLSREELGILPDDMAVAYVGRLVPGKGLAELLDALDGQGSVSLVLVGDGPLRGELETKAAASGLRVYFAGSVTSPAAYYDLADVVVLPSRMEALPMTLVEAAAHGKPVVATRVGGIPEVVRDGESGLLVECGDMEGLRSALDRCRDVGLRTRMGARARELWAQGFTPSRMAEDLTRVYRGVVDR